ncbi:Protein-lysine N-methyltransferase efm5 [Entomophthora muscae]|uniref:Protein-lysine N-methyltransferase efm5 n=1 Tax=Entomophthora muscae TaxID=34485 RepID=A0ACC2TW28_9FUNG|nr:Protein-lysine N-methyltransferase efm5 [Entomophthora muscae]
MDDVHNKGAATIARACRESGVDRLIHFSALNADEQSPSHFYASKARGEISVKTEFPEATIVRPATIYGPEDYFLNRIGITKHFHYIVNNGKRTLYPVNSQDVAVAVDVITQEPFAYNGKVFELAGPDLLQYTEIIEMCSEILKEDIRTINLPVPVLTLMTKVFKLYPYRVLRPEEVPLMLINDKLHENTLKFSDLGITPQSLEHCILTMMRMFRTNVFYELGYDNDVPRNAKP